MTFKLKDFKELKKHFDETVETILQRDKIDSIDSVADTRRKEELFFLKAVMTELEARSSKQLKGYPAMPAALCERIFAGALLVAQQDIRDTANRLETPEKSLLYRRIDDALATKGNEKATPSAYQKTDFYQCLNEFLATAMYKSSSSRQGLKVPNIFDAIPTKRLLAFADITIQQETTARHEVSSKYGSGGKTEARVSAYRPQGMPAAPSVTTDKYGTFTELKVLLEKLIVSEFASKNAEKIDALSGPRRTQLLMLKAVADSLAAPAAKGIKEEERVAVLAGTMLLVREQIGHQYSKTRFQPKAISTSVVHKSLTKILNVEDMTLEDAFALLHSARNYIHYMTIEPVESNGVALELVRSKHIFSDISKKFSITPIIDLLHSLMGSARQGAMVRCFKDYETSVKAASGDKATSSFFESYNPLRLFKAEAKPKEVGEDEVDELDKDDEKERGHDRDDQKSYEPPAKTAVF